MRLLANRNVPYVQLVGVRSVRVPYVQLVGVRSVRAGTLRGSIAGRHTGRVYQEPGSPLVSPLTPEKNKKKFTKTIDNNHIRYYNVIEKQAQMSVMKGDGLKNEERSRIL